MSAFDFNTATEQRSFDTIPDGTVAVIQLNIRAGDAGPTGLFKRSKTGEAEGLDAEFIVFDGPYAKRKFFGFMVLSGTTDGHAQAADISRSRLRAILESARGIKPTDVSETAKKARVAEYDDFDGMRFMGKIGVEPAKDGYKAKNVLASVITPDMKGWHPIEQLDRSQLDARKTSKADSAEGGASSNAIVKPAWAK
jgi:hypothetical protein